MSAETLINVEGVSKKFCRNLKKSLWYGMQDLGCELIGRPHGGKGGLRADEFWAVKDVNFELRRGECLGLIGRNGAGKSTLLRMLNGLIKPDAGRITMRGRVGALIALGAGFNPILTGRENIYVNAAVLGLSKSYVDRKMEEIIEFSGISEFIDMPVQSYSSGMNVRLGFSVAAILIKPDILFLDEVLAVGDIGFTIKCLNAVRVLSLNSAVVFVSHNMQYISAFCSRVMVLGKGQVLLDSANNGEGISYYYSLMDYLLKVDGTGEARIKTFDIFSDGVRIDGDNPAIIQGSKNYVRMNIDVSRKSCAFTITLFIIDASMTPILCIPVNDNFGQAAKFKSGNNQFDISLGVLDLAGGKYSFVVTINDYKTKETLARIQGLKPFQVIAENFHWGYVVRPSVFSTCKENV